MTTYEDEEKRVLKAELAEAKALLNRGRAKIMALLSKNLDLEIALKRETRSFAKNVSFSDVVSGAWSAAGHGNYLPPVYCTNTSCEGGPTWLLLTPHPHPRVSLTAKTSCEDGPATHFPKVPTREVRVYNQGRRVVMASRRCAMRAFQTGKGLTEYWSSGQFETRHGSPLKASDIDWTGYGDMSVISLSLIGIKADDGRSLGPLERAFVLDEFKRLGGLPVGYRFPLAYPNLHPNDVNWEK